MTRCYEFYCVYLQNPSFCEEKSDKTVYNINRFIEAMKARGIKFDKSQEDKALFQAEDLTERDIIQPHKPLQQVTPSSEKCPICETEPILGLHECELCHLSTSQAVEYEGHFFCKQEHADRAKQLGLFKPQPKSEVKEWKPKETLEQRVAVMHPQKSRMEEALLLKLHEKGLTPIVDQEFCIHTTTPDFYFPDKNLAIYIDGAVHEGQEDRDNQLRDLLTQRHNVRVVSIQYKDFTEEETERVFQQIIGES